MEAIQRCGWCSDDPLYQHYHDEEWGIAQYQRDSLFEMLCLEGQQAGLSWITVLKKRENYRQRFFNFNPELVAAITDQQLEDMLQDAGLIRHRGKLSAIRDNAKAWLAYEAKGVNMVDWLWSFIGGTPQINQLQHYTDGATKTAASQAMSKALKKAGFRFVGETTCYAFMQAVGMVNDHQVNCAFYKAQA